MTNPNLLKFAPQEYYVEFISALNYPMKIWKVAFNAQISKPSKYLLYTLFFIGDCIFYDDLKRLSYEWAKLSDPNLTLGDYAEIFDTSLRELENSFLKIDIYNNKSYISFHNPSIRDYILSRIKENLDLANDYNDLPILFWNQKIELQNFLSEDKENIRKNTVYMLSNIDLKSANYGGNRYLYVFKENKLEYLLNVIFKYDFADLKQPLYESALNCLIQTCYISYYLFEVLKKIPVEYVDENAKTKLLELFDKTASISNMIYFCEFNDFLHFIPKTNLEYKIKEIIETELDSCSSFEDFDNLRYSLEELSSHVEYDMSRTMENIEQKMMEMDSENCDDSEDFEIDDYKGVAQNSIELLFKTLKK